MRTKALSTVITFAYAIFSNAFSLSAQPYGYPYDPYNFLGNDPYNPPLTTYYNAGSFYNRPNYLNNPYYPRNSYYSNNPYYPRNPYLSTGRPPLVRQVRPAPSPYPLPYMDRKGRENNDDQSPAVANSTESKIDQILKFWFGPLSSPIQFPADKISLWEGSPGGDRLIREQFSGDYQRAVLGQYGSWRDTPEGRLALIILLDQFPRHIYLDQPQMFASDSMARGLAIEGIQLGEDQDLYPIERAFFYMPLQHSENPEMQAMSVKLYEQLVAQTPPPIKPILFEFLRLAIKHQEVINRFGRFPHRNKVLGRKSTPEEMVYLGHKAAFRY